MPVRWCLRRNTVCWRIGGQLTQFAATIFENSVRREQIPPVLVLPLLARLIRARLALQKMQKVVPFRRRFRSLPAALLELSFLRFRCGGKEGDGCCRNCRSVSLDTYRQCTSVTIDHCRSASCKVSSDDLSGEDIFYFGLQQPAHRSGAEQGIVTVLYAIGTSLIGDSKLQLLCFKAPC